MFFGMVALAEVDRLSSENGRMVGASAGRLGSGFTAGVEPPQPQKTPKSPPKNQKKPDTLKPPP